MAATRAMAAALLTLALSGPPSVRYWIVAAPQVYGSPLV
jgi:hypothetical protein